MKHEHDEAMVEQVCRTIYPELFSDDEPVSHRAASPFSVEGRREARRKHIRAILSLIRTTDAARIASLESALRPFAEAASEWDGEPPALNVEFAAYDPPRMNPSALVADFRLARATLRSNPDD